MKIHTLFPLLLVVVSGAAIAAEAVPAKKGPATGPLIKITPELRAAVAKLEMPGVKINLDEWSVDLDGRICLKAGLLELIACTKDSKEHEAVVTLDGKPSHAHTALLLLGARPGSPAMMQAIDPEMTSWRHIPPSGGPVDVFLVVKDAEGKETEKPISDFIIKADREGIPGERKSGVELEKFPTHTFLFAGSILTGEGDGPRQYLADSSGNVISITTFGDELLCLPDVFEHSNESLMWEVDGDKLPDLDSKVILRLRPQINRHKAPEAPKEKPTAE